MLIEHIGSLIGNAPCIHRKGAADAGSSGIAYEGRIGQPPQLTLDRGGVTEDFLPDRSPMTHPCGPIVPVIGPQGFQG